MADDDASPMTTVHLAGEFDISRTAELRDALLTGPPEETIVVADLADVTFMDSTGLRSLIEVRNTLQERGATLVVTNPSPTIHRLLAVTETLALFGLPES